jgi:hypothetical protein
VLWALRLFAHGEANGTWVVQVARGWPGFEGAPAAAGALMAAWLLALVFTGMRLWRALRPEATVEPAAAQPGAAG